MRKLEGQKTLLGRTMHSIAYDELHDEFFLPVPFPQAILAFRGGADGEEAPVRYIQGPSTGLTYPNRLAVDPVHNEIFVPQTDKILVYPRDGNGDVAPLRVLQGPDTLLETNAVAVDPVRNLLIVVSELPGEPEAPRILIFNRTDNGNVKPRAIIGGPKSWLPKTLRAVHRLSASRVDHSRRPGRGESWPPIPLMLAYGAWRTMETFRPGGGLGVPKECSRCRAGWRSIPSTRS